MIKEELLYELVLEDPEDGVFANSFVQSPAIERDFVFFGKEIYFQTVSNEKRLVAGPLLIPNKKILRLDGEGKPYYVFFKPETIEQVARKFMKNKFNGEVTVEHEKKVDGIYLTESWIIEQTAKDKSNIYGYTLPKGTWFGIYKVDNDDVWNDIKLGKFRGFSIEGLFENKLSNVKLSLVEKDITELSEEEANVVLSQIKALIKKDKRYKSKQRIEMESYSDYGINVQNNAKRGIELNDRNGNKCATQTGKVRAQQLAKGEPISIETIKRMYSYLSRAEVYYDNAKSQNECGYISYLLWGGKSALSWSRNKLRELGLLEEAEVQPSIQSSYPGQGPTKRKRYKSPSTFSLEEGNVNVFGIETEYFDMCPMAKALFEHLVSMEMDEDTIGMVRSAALVADKVFDIEEDVIEDMKATPKDLGEAITLVKDFKDIMKEIDERVGMKHDVSFMDNHIKMIKSYL